TTDGVVRAPSAFAITTGLSPSITATHELVVPRSIPTTRGMSGYPGLRCVGGMAGLTRAPERPWPWRPRPAPAAAADRWPCSRAGAAERRGEAAHRCPAARSAREGWDRMAGQLPRSE